jgi:hypothetical protein
MHFIGGYTARGADAFRYTNLCARIESKAGLEVLQHVQSITLREGFRAPSDICEYS